MTTPLRAALIGCGSLSQRGVLPHLSELDACARIQLVAVADAVLARAQASAARWGVPHAFASVEELLAAVDVDIVLVITPIAHHYANAMAAITAGKHVYVQKAMTVTTAEADALLHAAQAAGVRLAAAPGYELFPFTAQIRAAAAAIGQIYSCYTYTHGFGHEKEAIRGGESVTQAIDPGWYYRAGAGPLPDVTVYSLQLLTSVLGPVRRVTALANTRVPERTWRDRQITIEVPDNNAVLMELHSGAIAVAAGTDSHGSQRNPWGGMEIFGNQGVLTITDVEMKSGYPVEFLLSGTVHRAKLGDQPYLTGQHLAIEEPHVYVDIMDLVDAIRDDRSPRASGDQARHVVEIIEAARTAIATGSTQTLRTTFTIA